MAIFYSPSQSAFYDDAIHGARALWVTDEDALRAALSALTEREFADDPEPDDAALEAIAAERAALLRTPPVKLVEDPDCRLPEDAVAITDACHAELMQGQAEGRMIVWDEAQAAPVLVDRPVDHEALLASVKKERDRLLRESDWTQLADNELTKAERAAWKAWRQEVRKLARGYEFTDPSIRPDLAGFFPPAPAPSSWAAQ